MRFTDIFSVSNHKSHSLKQSVIVTFCLSQIFKWQTGDPVSYQLIENKHHLLAAIAKFHLDIDKQEINCKGYIYGGINSYITCMNQNLQQENFTLDIDALDQVPHQLQNQNVCSIMVVQNLAQPEWIHVSCSQPLLQDVVCVTPDATELTAPNGPSLSSEPRIQHKSCVLIDTACYTFVSQIVQFIVSDQLCSGSVCFKRGVQQLLDHSIFTHVFAAVHVLFPPVFSRDLKQFMNYTRYLDNFAFKWNILTEGSVIEGVCIVHGKRSSLWENDVFKCKDGTYISYMFVCDENLDCPDGDSSDETECRCGRTGVYPKKCKFVTDKQNKTRCSFFYFPVEDNKCLPYKAPLFASKTDQPSSNDTQSVIPKLQLPCQDGEPKVYNVSDICIYKLQNNQLIPCEHGEHLQQCKEFECNMMFKCPEFYCIHWSSVCNGRWDCPSGLDESVNQECATNRTCMNMLKCLETSICVHLGDVNDGTIDCPLGDDEFFNTLKDSTCLSLCQCLAQAIMCSSIDTKYIFEPLPFYVVKMHNVSFADNTKLDNKFAFASLLTVLNTSLMDVCSFVTNMQYLVVLDSGYNKFHVVQKRCFQNSKNLSVLKLNNNKLSEIQKEGFWGLRSLKLLDLSDNLLLGFPEGLFPCLTKLHVLKLENNDLTQITKNMFSGIGVNMLLTSDYRICCVAPSGSNCNA